MSTDANPSEQKGNPTKEGRHRVFYVKPRTIIGWLDPGKSSRSSMPRIVGLPADAYVSSVNYDFKRAAFCFTVDSMEFGRVLEGDLIPEVTVFIET
jgi:hypothetical protein